MYGQFNVDTTHVHSKEEINLAKIKFERGYRAEVSLFQPSTFVQLEKGRFVIGILRKRHDYSAASWTNLRIYVICGPGSKLDLTEHEYHRAHPR